MTDRTKGAYFSPSAVEFVPSGCALLDCVLGGGYAVGRIINIVGDKSTGKTLLAIEAATNFAAAFPQAPIWYNEVEATFDPQYAARLGMPIDRVEFVKGCMTVEDLFEDLETRTAGKRAGLYILDSLDALSNRAEQKAKIDEQGYGVGKAKALSQMFRRLVQSLAATGVTVIIISQIRTNIGVMFGAKYVRAGGRALDFYASQVLYLSQIEVLYKTVAKQKRATGIVVRVKCTKNKVGVPFRQADMPILFFYGIDDIAANLAWLEEVEQLESLELGSSVRRIHRSLLAMLASDFAPIRKRIAQRVIRVWNDVETHFLPEREKYERSEVEVKRKRIRAADLRKAVDVDQPGEA